jgi:hypothetical protein
MVGGGGGGKGGGVWIQNVLNEAAQVFCCFYPRPPMYRIYSIFHNAFSLFQYEEGEIRVKGTVARVFLAFFLNLLIWYMT